MNKSLLLYIILLTNLLSYEVNAQSTQKLSGQIFSVDYNIGYNISRNHSNYLFDEKIPFSFQLNWHKANYFDQEKVSLFGYSDFGITFLYHDYRNQILGKNYGLYVFMDYYLLKPSRKFQLSLRISQGLAYNTSPFNRENNFKNHNFGSHILTPFDFAFYLKTPKIYKKWRMQFGLAVFHYSNANKQSPNLGINTPSLTLGLQYDLRPDKIIMEKKKLPYNKTWQYIIFTRTGINESDYIDSGQFFFIIPGIQVEKHLSFRNKISFGTELFISYFLKELIKYEYHSVPEKKIDEIKDFKRIGVFAQHEFFYKKFGIGIGAGYYIYYPYPFESRYYNRMSLKFYVSNHWRLVSSLKIHHFVRAESLELGLMYKI